MLIAWATDIHWDHIYTSSTYTDEDTIVPNNPKVDFLNEIKLINPDLIVITGDIGEAPSWHQSLVEVYDGTKIPIYYVLGNHDYYGKQAKHPSHAGLKNLGIYSFSINRETIIVGSDGWWDCVDAELSNLVMSDFFMNPRLVNKNKIEIIEECKAISKRENDNIIDQINSAIVQKNKNIIVATHVPPWLDNSRYNGKISNHNWSPWFVNKSLGDQLNIIALDNPDVNFLVLCGHSHEQADFEYLPNLRCITGQAQYGFPKVAGIIEITDTVKVTLPYATRPTNTNRDST